LRPADETSAADPWVDSGVGIGLAVVHDLVEAHGGSVVARSRGENLGSEFAVTLPMRP
jgi:signal transduction histidine kinase